MNEQEFWAALAPLPEPPPPIYRLYYGEHGEPLFYSMEDLPGNYITLTRETFFNTPKYCQVVNGELKVLDVNPVLKLKPNGVGTPCHPQDISIVVEETQPHTKWSLE